MVVYVCWKLITVHCMNHCVTCASSSVRDRITISCMQPCVVGPTVYTEPAPLLAPSPNDAFAVSVLQSRAEEVCMQLTNEYEERLAVVSAYLRTVYVCSCVYIRTYVLTCVQCMCVWGSNWLYDVPSFRNVVFNCNCSYITATGQAYTPIQCAYMNCIGTVAVWLSLISSMSHLRMYVHISRAHAKHTVIPTQVVGKHIIIVTLSSL